MRKVVTLATPFRGSFEAILKVATGTAEIGDDAKGARERRAARVTPALYHLLPRFEGALRVPPELPDDPFDSRVWQSSVVGSIETYVRNRGLPTNDPETAAESVFRAMLAEARNHRDRVETLDLGALSLKERWLAVAGVNTETRIGLSVELDAAGQPYFDLTSDLRLDQWSRDAPEERYKTGDGTVPLRAAVPTFLDPSALVCVAPADFGYWEWRDRGLSSLAGFHGFIPNMNMLHRLIIRFLTDAEDRHGNTWGRRLPGVGEWKPPLKNLREKDGPEA